MEIIAMEKEVKGVKPEDFTPFLKDETKEVLKLYDMGLIREIFFREDRNEAVLILECSDLKEAGLNLNRLPLVKNKLIELN